MMIKISKERIAFCTLVEGGAWSGFRSITHHIAIPMQARAQ